jgi:hypothetical protein
MITLCMIGQIVSWKDETVFQKIIATIQCIGIDCIYIIPLAI